MVATFSLLVLLSSGHPQDAQSGIGSRAQAPIPVRGQVRVKGTRRPIAEARILGPGGTVALSDERGNFLFEASALPVNLEVSAPGYRSAVFRVQASEHDVFRLEPLPQYQDETIVRERQSATAGVTHVLTGSELTSTAGTLGDPFRAVMLLPGVAAAASGLSYPIVRGAQPASTAYFLDGVRMPFLYHLLGAHSVVHPEFLGGLAFSPGVTGAGLGRFLGGAVEASVAKSSTSSPLASAYADLLNLGGYLDVPISSTGTSVTLAGRFSYTPWLIGVASQLVTPPDAQGYRPRPVADFYDYQARLEQRLGVGRFRILAFGMADQAGVDYDDPERVDVRAHTAFHRLDLRWTQVLFRGAFASGVTLGVDSIGLGSHSDAGPLGQFEFASTSYSGRARYKVQIEQGLDLEVGADIAHARAESSLTVDPVDLAGETAFVRPSAISTEAGLFGSVVWKPNEAFSITAGLRGDNYHLVPGFSYFVVEPRLLFSYHAMRGVVVKGGAGVQHQPPTVLVNLPLVDMAGLRYGVQEGLQFDLGVDCEIEGGWQIGVNGYAGYLSRSHEFFAADLILSRNDKGVIGKDLPGQGRSLGVEVMARKRLGTRWHGWLSYSLSRTERFQEFVRLDGYGAFISWERAFLPSAFDQTHVLNAAMTYRFPGDIQAGVVVHLNSGRPESGVISSRGAEVIELEGRRVWRTLDLDRVGRLPAFFRVDARLSKAWVFDDVRVEAYADLQNASVSSEVYGYSYIYQLDGDGAVVPLKQSVSFPVVLPMIGVKAVF